MGIQVRALAPGYDGVVLRETDTVFTLPDSTVPGPWFEALDAEGAKKLADNKAKDDYERAKAGALLARRATDKAPVVEALKPAEKRGTLADARKAEFDVAKSNAEAQGLGNDLV